MADAGSKKHLLSSFKFILKPPHGRLQRAGAAAGRGSCPRVGGGGCCWEAGGTPRGPVQPFSLCALLPLPVDAAMRCPVIDGELRAQVPNKHSPGNTDSTSLEKSVSISVCARFAV